MKHLIFGRNGWLAQKFNNFLDDSQISDIDITDLAAVRKELDEKKPEVVINAAGVTGRPNIDWCEEHKLETVAGNVAGPLNILQACQERDVFWVHLSSGCIFQGSGPHHKGFSALGRPASGWKEEDEASPPSFYSWSKYWADSILKHFPVLIVRLRLPIDIESNPRNLIDKLLKYSQIIDSENSITVIPDFLEATKKLIEKKRVGVYHLVNPGPIKPSDIMRLYKKIVDSSHKFKVISEKELYKRNLVKATRSSCVLNTDKLKKEGIILKPIQKRIVEIIKEYKKNL